MQTSKLPALDSVRGVAALVVVFHHAACAFAPELIHGAYLPWLRVPFQGTFAVRLFFVLSGFVLSLSYLRSSQIEVLRSATVRRYFRLAVPIAAAVALAYLLLAGGLYFNDAAGATAGQPESSWLRRWYRFEPSAASAVHEAGWRAFFQYRPEATYNNVLWTMGVEFQGSLFVFAFLALAGNLRNRGLVYALLGMVLWNLREPFMLDFLAGTALADLHVRRGAAAVDHGRDAYAMSLLLAVTGLTVAGLVPTLPDPPGGRRVASVADLWLTAAAVMVVAAVVRSGVMQRVLCRRPLVALGKISFPLYLVHVPVLCSLSCYVYVTLVAQYGMAQGPSAVLASAAGVVASLALACAGAVTVEPLSIWVGRQVDTILFSHPRAGAAAE